MGLPIPDFDPQRIDAIRAELVRLEHEKVRFPADGMAVMLAGRS
jgi:hypothetical protein